MMSMPEPKHLLKCSSPKPLPKTQAQAQVQAQAQAAAVQRQEVLLHQHDQEHGQPLALLRGLIQASTPSSKMEVSNQQVEIVELREAKLWYLCHEELNYQLCATVQWASS
ncbi:unnamed protein product [Sphagnum balticum]